MGGDCPEKVYMVEHIPSSPGEPGLIFTLLPLAHAATGIPPNLPGMAHSATRRSGQHRTTGNPQMAHRWAVWAPLRQGSLRRTQVHNLIKTYPKGSLWPKSQQCTKENESP